MSSHARAVVRRLVLVVGFAAAAAAVPSTASAATDATKPFLPPVDRPVSRAFVGPTGPYGRGHRGLDYAVRPGDVVTAIGDGVVVFVGLVAGNGYITVLHSNGLRSSYSYVKDFAVTRGRRVHAGAPVATTTARFMLTIRLGDVYLDPALLIGNGGVTRPRHARLVRWPGST